MNSDEIRNLLERLAGLVAEQYVFPEVGREVATRLRTAAAEGRYDDLTDPERLAAQVTADLQEGNQDKHLRLKFHRTEVPDETDPAAEEQYWLDRVRLDAGGIARVERLPGNVGLLELRPLLFDPQHAGAAITAAMTLLAGTDALLLDLRGCVGGSPDQVALICSHLFDGEPIHLNDLVTPATGDVRQFWTFPHLTGPRYGGAKPIWTLTSNATFSGGEELAYDLQQLGRAKVVGERTRGGAHPRDGFKLHQHLEATIPVKRAINPISGTNWEGVGVVPDLEVAATDAYDVAYREAVDHILGLPAVPERLGVLDEARATIAGL